MAISLKNHEDRITALEGKIGTNLSDTGWINGTFQSFVVGDIFFNQKILRYKVMNSIIFMEIGCKINSTGNKKLVGNLPNWKYGTVYFSTSGSGDNGGGLEAKSLYVDNSGNLYCNCVNQYNCIMRGTSVFPLTIYYIVRYNIYRLVLFLSHLNIKFGGERR